MEGNCQCPLSQGGDKGTGPRALGWVGDGMVVGIRGAGGTGTRWYQGGSEHMVGVWWAWGWLGVGLLIGMGGL